jgi:signal transduction histidine kinase
MPLKTSASAIVFASICIAAHAQTNVIDSLRSVISSGIVPTKKIQPYIQLSGRLSTASFAEAIKIAEQGLQIAQQEKDSFAIAELNRNMGVAYYFKGDYEKAASLYYESLYYFERNNKTLQQAMALNDIAKLCRKSRDLTRAAVTYERALTIFRQLKDSSGIQMILNESGVVYKYQGNYNEAIRRYRASLDIATRLKDEAGKSWCYNFIASVYVLQNKYEDAEDYNLRALAIRQTLKDTFTITLSYFDLGVLYSSWGKYERAQYYFEQSAALADKMQYRELVSNNYAELSKLANMQGNYKGAFDYYMWHTQLKDSIFNAQKTRQIEEISTIYETSKREQQIHQQQATIRKRNVLLYSALLLILVSLLIAYLLYNRYRLKQQAKLQQEILLQQQMAAKAVLEAEEKERSRIAKELHDSVGQMMSVARMNLSSFAANISLQSGEQHEALSNIIELVNESCKEVRAVSHSMMPLSLISKGLPQAIQELISRIDQSLLQVSFHHEGFENRANSNTETILYRVIQECVNNTLKHAGATHLDISLIKDHDGISATIEDDGRGMNINDAEEQGGMGLKNIRSRVQFLKGSIEFHSQPGNGTLVAIHIP